MQLHPLRVFAWKQSKIGEEYYQKSGKCLVSNGNAKVGLIKDCFHAIVLYFPRKRTTYCRGRRSSNPKWWAKSGSSKEWDPRSWGMENENKKPETKSRLVRYSRIENKKSLHSDLQHCGKRKNGITLTYRSMCLTFLAISFKVKIASSVVSI